MQIDQIADACLMGKKQPGPWAIPRSVRGDGAQGSDKTWPGSWEASLWGAFGGM